MSDWHVPEDPGCDLAVSAWRPAESVPVVSLPARFATSRVGRPVELGESAFKVGLWEASRANPIPVVRSGTVAALDEYDIEWQDEDEDGSVIEGTWSHGHLIDVKSKGGFSGGPVYVQRRVAREWMSEVPDEWRSRASAFGTNTDTWMEIATFTDWWGLFVGHADQSGVGVVIPVEDIIDFVSTEMGEVVTEK